MKWGALQQAFRGLGNSAAHQPPAGEFQFTAAPIEGKGHFAGSEGGRRSAAVAFTLIQTAKLKGVDPQAWLTDVLRRIADHRITRPDELLPWHYAAAAA